MPPACDPNYQERIWIQYFDRNNACDFQNSDIGVAWKNQYPRELPQILQRISFSSSDWEAFQSAIDEEVGKFQSQHKTAICAFSAVILLEIISFLLVSQGIFDSRFRFIFSLIGWLLLFAYLSIVQKINEAIDREISQLCQRFSQEWSTRYSNQVSLAYQTQFTEFCRPKGARPLRWILISNNVPGAQIQMQSTNFIYGQPQQGYAVPTQAVYVAEDGTTKSVQQPVTAVAYYDSQAVVGRVV